MKTTLKFLPDHRYLSGSALAAAPQGAGVCQNVTGSDPDKTNVEHGWSPFRPLPNVRKFKVRINDYDPVFKDHGIDKRLPPEFKFDKYTNGKLNRYM
jgi:hypothetical protein